jgi:hypothetical protein
MFKNRFCLYKTNSENFHFAAMEINRKKLTWYPGGGGGHIYTDYFIMPKSYLNRCAITIKLKFKYAEDTEYHCIVQDTDYSPLTQIQIHGSGDYTVRFFYNTIAQLVRLVFMPRYSDKGCAVPIKCLVMGERPAEIKNDKNLYTFLKGKNETLLQQLFADGFILRFIKANITNPLFFKPLQEIYNYFRYMETRFFLDIFKQRIEKNTVPALLDQQFGHIDNKDIIIVLSDIKEPFGDYTCIDIDDIDTIANQNERIFIPVYNKDWKALRALQKLSARGLKYHLLKYWTCPPTRYFLVDENLYKTLEDEVSHNPRGHFAPQDYENIAQVVQATKNIPGDYVEIGVYQGASARFASSYLKRVSIDKKTWFIDTYEGFVYSEAQQSENAGWENTHTDTSLEAVREYLADYPNARLVKQNIITDELPSEIKQIAVCNIDVDMYEAILSALHKADKRMSVNGIIIVQDYGSTPPLIGALKAAHEFLEEKGKEYISLYMGNRQLLLIKRGGSK